MPFRRLALPPAIPGRLYLSSMPGRYQGFPQDKAEALALGIKAVVRLTSDEETGDKSAMYLDAIKCRLLPWVDLPFPLPDYGIPADAKAFRAFVAIVAERLKAGEAILVHCAAGIGRTGTFAACLLMEFGLGLEESVATVPAAGSRAEDRAQVNFLAVYMGPSLV